MRDIHYIGIVAGILAGSSMLYFYMNSSPESTPKPSTDNDKQTDSENEEKEL